MVLMGSHGSSSILVMGTVDVSGPHCCPSILEVGPHGQLVDGCGGHSLCFVVVVRREG